MIFLWDRAAIDKTDHLSDSKQSAPLSDTRNTGITSKYIAGLLEVRDLGITKAYVAGHLPDIKNTS